MKKNKLLKFIIVIIVVIGYYFYNEFNDNFTDKREVQNKVVDDSIKSSHDLEIYFLDVGQADSILIRYLDNSILIDAGNNDDGSLLVEYFKSLDISTFNYVIGTHAHEDHIGGMDNIINSFKILHYLMPKAISTSKTFEDVLDSLENNKVSVEVPVVDSEFYVGDLKFKVIYVGEDEDDLNNSSIVLKLTYKNTSYLFMGDATSKVEKEILDKDIKSDVLKIGHHGSQYSSTAHFLKKVEPSFAIIQCGVGNSYGHPKEVTLNKLNKIGTKIYRTDLDHTIRLTSDGDNISFDTFETNTNGGQ